MKKIGEHWRIGAAMLATLWIANVAKPQAAGQQFTAPFQIVNSAGKVLMEVREVAGPGNGVALYLMDGNGAPTVMLTTIAQHASLDLLESPAPNASSDTLNQGAAKNYISLDSVVGLEYSHSGQIALLNDDQKNGIGFRLKNGGFTSNTAVSLDLAGGVGNLHLFDGDKPAGALTVTPGSGGQLQLNSGSGTAGFTAGLSGSGDGFARVVSKAGPTAGMGTDGPGTMGFRIFAADTGPPSGGITLQPDKSSAVYAGAPGKPLALMRVIGGLGESVVANDSGNVTGILRNTAAGGTLIVAGSSGQTVASMEPNPSGVGGHASFYDSGGSPVLKMGAIGANQGDACITRGDKPGKCLSQTVLPLSISQ